MSGLFLVVLWEPCIAKGQTQNSYIQSTLPATGLSLPPVLANQFRTLNIVRTRMILLFKSITGIYRVYLVHRPFRSTFRKCFHGFKNRGWTLECGRSLNMRYQKKSQNLTLPVEIPESGVTPEHSCQRPQIKRNKTK